MTKNTTPPSAFPDEQREARGILGFVKALSTATEHFFRRHYLGDSLSPEAEQQLLALRQERDLEKARAASRETEIARLTAVLESIGEGVILQNTEGRTIMMNEAATTLLGGKKAFWESELARVFERSLATFTFEGEFETVGEPVRLEVNDRILRAQIAAVADRAGERLGTVIVLRDITRTALADRLKEDFITQVSHELRTPLTAIKGMSDVLLTQPADRPPNRRFLEAISRNVDVLDRMIVELLDISEISGGTFSIRQEALVLDDLVWSVVRGLQSRWERAGLEVHVLNLRREATRIQGDNRRLRWALGHLLENSINYTLEGGVITFTLGETNQGRTLIRLEDTGVGVNEVDLPHIFNRFYRGEAKTPDGRTIDPRGLGQGLFIARAVAEAHNGFLSVASKVGVGTTFTLGLPLPDAALIDEPPPDAEATLPNPRLALPPEGAPSDVPEPDEPPSDPDTW